MSRTNYTSPDFIARALEVADTEHDPEIVNAELARMAQRHDKLLQAFFRTLDGYNQLLDAHGPFHEIELGEPVTRFDGVLRKALNDTL